MSKISARRLPELLFSKFAIQESLKVLLESLEDVLRMVAV